MLRWFQARIDPYPLLDAVQPPTRMLPFFIFYVKGAMRWLAIMAVLIDLWREATS